MRSAVPSWLAAVALAWACWPASAQQPAPKPAPAAPAAPPPAMAGVAATVNGQPITETAVQRGLKRVDPSQQAEARAEIINVLTDNLLIDQHLMQLNVAVDAKEVDAKLQQIKDEIVKASKDRPELTFDAVLKELMMTEAELKAVITADMRWDNYTAQQATDKVLQDYFNANKEVFDGSLVHARHILIKPADATPQSGEKAKAELLKAKQEIEKKVAEEVAKTPSTADALAREQARARALEDAFAAQAHEKSACPSKQHGGDVGEFPRAGSMVEPFAKVAFSLKPYTLSDVVQTQFGYHLLLVVDKKPGRDVKFEDMKSEVKEVYCERMREQLCAQLRPKAAIVVNPAPK